MKASVEFFFENRNGTVNKFSIIHTDCVRQQSRKCCTIQGQRFLKSFLNIGDFHENRDERKVLKL